jgi:hypothetical protein
MLESHQLQESNRLQENIHFVLILKISFVKRSNLLAYIDGYKILNIFRLVYEGETMKFVCMCQ